MAFNRMERSQRDRDIERRRVQEKMANRIQDAAFDAAALVAGACECDGNCKC